MMEKRSSQSDMVRKIAITAGVMAVALVAGFEIFHVLNSGTSEKKHVMEVVQLKLIPPPPPPKVEPPPEPPKMVEQKIQPPVDKPDDKPKDKAPDKPPPGPLALDAKGGPGSDAFGLGGKPGGSDYIGGNGGGGNGWGHYGAMMQDQIGKRLHQDDALDVRKFRITLKVWLTAAGKVNRVEVLHTAGDAEIDTRVREDISSMEPMPEAPAPEMPQPVVVRVGARPVSES